MHELGTPIMTMHDFFPFSKKSFDIRFYTVDFVATGSNMRIYQEENIFYKFAPTVTQQ